MNITETTTVNQILETYGLDFTILKLPLVAIGGENTNDDLTIFNNNTNDYTNSVKTNYFGLLNSKSNEIINTVKGSYEVSQNREVVELVMKGIAPFGNQFKVTNAGSINGGRKVFLQLEIVGDARVGNDKLTQYVTIIDSNDGSTGLSVGIGDECVRCENQFFKFYRAGQSKFRHTVSMQQRIKEIPYLVEMALNENLKQINLYNKFQSTPITRELAHKMVKSLIGIDNGGFTSTKELSEKSTKSINIMDAIYTAIDTEINQVGLNAWALLGGVTRYTTHHQSAPNRENGKIESLLLGGGSKLNIKAEEFLIKELVY